MLGSNTVCNTLETAPVRARGNAKGFTFDMCC